MGQTPGFFLSRAIRPLVISAVMVGGSTSSVQRHFATKAREWQSSKNANLKEVHNLLHPSALRPEGPAGTLICSTVNLIMAASGNSNRTGCTSCGSLLMTASGCVHWPCRRVLISKDVPHLCLFITSVNEVIQMENSSLTLFTEEAEGWFSFPLKHEICKWTG